MRDLRALGLLVLLLVLTACSEARSAAGEPTGPSREDFAAMVQDRLGASPDGARCLTDYVFEDYSPAARQILIDEGVPGLPQGLWDPYLTGALVCLGGEP